MTRPGKIRALARGALLVLVTLYLPGAGCNLFETRRPDVSGDVLSIWEPPISPEVIVRNLENALESGTFNNYLRTMTEDFTFTPEQSDVFTIQLERPGENIFENWDREVETETAEAFSAAADAVRLELTNVREELEGSGRLRKYDYLLTLVRAGGDELYEGEVWFHIRQEDSGEWLIFGWEDKATSGRFDSWGLLKGRSRPFVQE